MRFSTINKSPKSLFYTLFSHVTLLGHAVRGAVRPSRLPRFAYFTAVLALCAAPVYAQQPVSPFPSVPMPVFGLPVQQGSSTNPFTNISFTGQALGGDGTASAPTYAFTSAPTTGWYLASGGLQATIAGTPTFFIRAGGASTGADGQTFTFGGAGDVILGRDAAATLQMGLDAAGPVTPQMFKSADRITSDGVGADLIIAGGRNRGASAGGSIIFQTSPAAGAGITGTLTTALTIASTGALSAVNGFTTYNNVATAGQGVAVVRAQATTGTVTNGGTASIATWTPGAADVEVEVSCRVNITTSTNHTFSCDVTYTDVSNAGRTRVLEMFPVSGTPLTSGLMTNAIGVGDYGSAVVRIGVKASTAITVRTSAGGTFTGVVYTASGTIKQM